MGSVGDDGFVAGGVLRFSAQPFGWATFLSSCSFWVVSNSCCGLKRTGLRPVDYVPRAGSQQTLARSGCLTSRAGRERMRLDTARSRSASLERDAVPAGRAQNSNPLGQVVSSRRRWTLRWHVEPQGCGSTWGT